MRTTLLKLAGTITHPILPEDLVRVLNPLWSANEVRARIVGIRHETVDAVTIELRTGGPIPPYRAGQHLRIGVTVDGILHWRTYSLTSPERLGPSNVEVTVKAIPDGLVSNHLVRRARVGEVVRVEGPFGDFVLGAQPRQKLLFLTAGSGITPVMSILRTLERAGPLDPAPDTVVVHSAPSPDQVIFGTELRRMAKGNLRLHEHHTIQLGRLTIDAMCGLVPDWAERGTWVCGPHSLLADAEAHWANSGLTDQLHLERFAPPTPPMTAGAAPAVTFDRTGRTVNVRQSQSLLEAGESAGVLMPSGCRMGICFSCVLPLKSGRVTDLRSGEVHGEPGDLIQTCVSSPLTDLVLDI